MKAVFALISRNRKLFFKDRGMFFSALITPGILILLYATFLANVYRDSFMSAIPDMITISDKLIDGTVAAQLAAALLAVSCVTVTFCVNLTMVQDRANGTRKDFNVSPISKAQLYLGYYLSTVVNSLLVNGLALVLCLGYMYKMGWYMSAVDVLWVLLDEILLVLFGSTLSSIVSFPLTTQGQLSAVGTIVSAGYGFLCGAYMPISNFGSGLQKVLSYLPSTYGTSLLKNHMLRGIFEEMENNQLPEEMITAIRDTLDCNPKFHGSVVSVNQMVMLMVGCVVVFGIIFLCMTALPEKEWKKSQYCGTQEQKEMRGFMVHLKKITEDNFLDAFNLRLAKGQESYVSHPVRSLAQANVYRDQCQPLGINNEDKMDAYDMVVND